MRSTPLASNALHRNAAGAGSWQTPREFCVTATALHIAIDAADGENHYASCRSNTRGKQQQEEGLAKTIPSLIVVPLEATCNGEKQQSCCSKISKWSHFRLNLGTQEPRKKARGR